MRSAVRKVGSVQVSFWMSSIFIGGLTGLAMYLIHTTVNSEVFIADVSATRGQYNELLKGRDLEDVDLYRE